MGHLRKRKDSQSFLSIWLAEDMNPEELKIDAERRKQLIERREKGESVMIKNGQIIAKRKNARVGDYIINRRRT